MGMNWNRCSNKWRSRDRECVLGEGRRLRNGSVTPAIPKDSLARRAGAEMDRWIKSLDRGERKRGRSRCRGNGASNRIQQRSHSHQVFRPSVQPQPTQTLPGWHWCQRERRLVTRDGTIVPLVDNPLVGNEREPAAYAALHGSGPKAG